jgi:pimeloyl-ACP methyl ester carboxylesterase
MGCASSCDYPQVAAQRALARRRRILVDLLGSGFSDRPARFGYTVGAHARVVAEFIRDMRLRRVCLYGHSLSGSVAITVAWILRNRISRLVLSEPNLDPGGGATSRAIARQNVENYVRCGHAELIRAARRRGDCVWAATMSVASPTAVHREAVSLVAGTRPSWREMLSDLPMQRTVLFGARSLPDPDTHALPAAGVRVRIVPGAGHGMAQDNPRALARALAEAIS